MERIEPTTPQALKELEEAARFRYVPKLEYGSNLTRKWLSWRSSRHKKKGVLSTRQLWLGTLFQKEIEEGAVPPVSVRWIGPEMGCGLFADAPIPRMGFIGIYAGVVRRRKRSDRHNAYCFAYQIIEGEETPYLIDAREQGSLVRFMNHSKTPNCTPYLATVGTTPYILLLAHTPIPAGAELTYHYGDDYWAKRPSPL